MLPFTAHCAAGHDRIDFTDRELFDYHMTVTHGIRKHRPGGAVWDHTPRLGNYYKAAPSAPGWGAAGILPPHPRKAPRPSPGMLTKVTDRIAAGEYVWPGGRYVGAPQPAAEIPTEAWELVPA